MFSIWYGMEMEEEDEKLEKLMWLKQGKWFTPLGRWIDFKLSEESRHLRAPKDSQNKTRERRTSLTNSRSIWEE